ncbi:MAG: beta-glucosidase [Inquilinus sp.]|nr:beta-glucosidase [Inquilinus sp.]
MTIAFPENFVWGASTSAYQIEGAVHEDGRGESIWDVFCRVPDAIRTGETGAIACDHYHLWHRDVALLRDLGVGAYRFSVAWPRIFPDGRGRPNAAGLDFYDRLVDALGEAGIDPWVCLYHWDLPQALERRDGWRNRDIAARFADYACTVANRLGDRVSYFLTLNEPSVTAWLGHATGEHAPGLAETDAFHAAIHHQNLAHGTAVDALRQENEGWKLGIVLSLAPTRPADDSQSALEAADMLDALWNGAFLDPIYHGRYPERVAPLVDRYVDSGDLERIARPLDLLGVNHYARLYARPDRAAVAGLAMGAAPAGAPTTSMGWEIDGGGLSETLLRLKDDYRNPPVFITENGAAFDDIPAEDGRVHDGDRIDYLREYIEAVASARTGGADVRGYFAWSLLDNFEWAEGYDRRFGLVHVDFETRDRTPKDSFRWYAELAHEGILR